MKNGKFSKILVLALSLALLIGSAVGIAASAETTDTASTGAILAQSIVHKDKIQIAFEVDATAAEAMAGTVTVNYYFDDATSDVKTAAVYVDAEGSAVLGTNGGVVFVTEGVSAQDLTSVVTATPYVGSAAKAPKTYSVAQFLLTKLYRDGFATTTDANDAQYGELYLSLIDYSAKAQAVFQPDETSINDWFYVNFDNATYNGENFIVSDEAITLDFADVTAATVANYTFKDKWNVTVDGTAASYATDATLEVSENTVVSPALEINAGTGKYFNDSSVSGIKLDFDLESDLGALTYNYSTSISTPTASIIDGVMYCNPTDNWNGFAIESGDTNTYTSGIYVFEADINYIKVVNQHTDGGNVFMGFQTASYEGISNDYCFDFGRITVDSTKTKYNIMNNYSSFNEDEPVLEVGTRYNVRFEYYTTTGITSIYVNGVLVDQNVADNSKGVNENSINGVETDKSIANNTFGDFIFIWRRYGEISFDNIFYGVVDGVVAE